MSLADVAEDRHDLPESIIWEYLVDLLQVSAGLVVVLVGVLVLLLVLFVIVIV